MKPVLLDLFCGAGGAAVGYARAGFEVIGVDNQAQPRYPFEFHRCDALSFLDELIRVDIGFFRFDAIHASPPCQRWSVASECRPGLREKYPDLVTPTRERVRKVGLPYVIENVPRCPLIDPVVLCGSQFGLQTWWPGKGRYGLRRHRLFETSFPLPAPRYHVHELRTIPVFGHNVGGDRAELKGPGFAKAAREVMGIDWMRREELVESVPPAYTEYVGTYLLAHLNKERMAA